MREWETKRMNFGHRHENKSCSACRDRLNERLKVAKVVKVKVFQFLQVFQNIPGSQLLSDIQTFLKLYYPWKVVVCLPEMSK